MGSNLYTGGTKFSKNGGASPPRTAFVHVPNFDQNRNLFFNSGLYTGGVFMLSSNLYTVRKNGGASPSRTLLFIVQTLVQNRNFFDPGRAPIICGRQQGVQDFCLSYGLFNIKQKLIKKVDKFDNDMQKIKLYDLSEEQLIISDELSYCEKHFERTHFRKPCGRYSVSLPFKENIQENVNLGDSRSIASKRLDQLWRRLDRDPKLNNLYTKFIEEYLSLDHMEEITNIDDITSEEGFFLPHHGVLRAGNCSRPLRVVFNGSQKTDLDISLNDVLYKGGVIQDDLFSIMLRARKHAYFFSCDISHMFRQIEIHPHQRHFQKILWKKENLESIILYGFSDASEKGFGAVTYVSVIKNNGDRRSQLLCSKSRVAPLKTLTIPRFLLNARSSKNKRVSGPLSLKELNQAEFWLIKLVQKAEFSNEIKSLLGGEPVHRSTFIAWLKRFFGRRGKSSKMFSDNGKTFVGANIELKKLHDLVMAPDETLVSYFNDEHIDWNFIPLRSPNFGGLWESGVKSFKTHLKRVAGSSNLTLEEFITLLAEIEAVLNLRPLSPLSSDFETLSPGHFLIGRPVTAIVEPQLINVKENRLTRWQRVNWLSQQIWKVWKRNYLNNLQERSKWRFSKNNVEIGTLVLIKNESFPGTKWPTGRILEVFYGNDNKIRVVNLKLPDGKIIKRNVTDICILPIE
ncbi:uncharacterized protein TNCV_3434451 [Trichonephila clavipes]|nr:uncharacterized protein TNCV_3434451 [Trichonephila clavipes]